MKKHLLEEMPFMATENILMYCVKNKGGDRQALHEAIREHSVKAAEQVKLYGKQNDLLDRIKADPTFALSEEELASLCDPNTFTGMAAQQTEEYLEGTVRPILEANKELLGEKAEVNV